MFEIRELTTMTALLRILAALLMGGLVGLERGLRNRPAGLRTYMLVCMGACLVMVINQYAVQAFGTGDPVRMGSQVISGIGFLGAGTIIVTRRNQIKGLTTAAGLWAAACVGLGLGLGLYEVAIPGAVLICLTMTALHEIDLRMRRRLRRIDAYVELERGRTMGWFIRSMRDAEVELSDIQLEREPGAEDVVSFIATLKGTGPMHHTELVALVRDMDGVAYVQEIKGGGG